VSFPAYSNYLDSGIAWLGKIPANWGMVPFWTLFRRVKRSGYPDEQLLSVYRDYGVVRKADRDDNFNKPSEDLSAYQLVEKGDLAINKMKAWQGSVGISEHRGIVSPAYFVYEALHRQNDRFLHYLLRSVEYTAGYLSLSKGIRVNQWDLDPAYHSRIPVLLPSRDEQNAIAAFLDRETAKIDALIEEQRRLIALLKEKRQAVVSHAVTKGLDPHGPMKDSGIEWLGEVPAHWEIKPLKYLATDFCDGPFGSGLKSEHYVDEGVRVIRLQNIKEDGFDGADAAFINETYFQASLTRHEVAAGDVLIAGLGDDRNRVGRACVAPSDIGTAMVKADCFRFRLTPSHDPHFVAAQLSAGAAFAAGKLSSGSTRSRIPATVMAQRRMAVPPLQEQQSISANIREISLAFNRLADTAQLAIGLLIERRAALIAAAVTGKIDVRQTGKLLPFPVDRARARSLVATEIIERSAHQPTFGRVKFQKIAFLIEGHVGVHELAGCYTREAAGPLDRSLITEMESGARSIAGIEVDQSGGTGTAVSYRLCQQRGAHRQELADWLGADRIAKLDKLIANFADLSTKGAEAVATLYGVWNDALIEGASPTDDEIISGFLHDWHPEKREKFRADELPTWLDWMRRHGIEPTGTGPKTTTGRLFA